LQACWTDDILVFEPGGGRSAKWLPASSLMLSGLLIAGLVLVLSAYWFRYNCRSILRTGILRERVEQVATANQLSFLQVEARLDDGGAVGELPTLNESLRRDYTVLTCLLRYTAAPGSAFSIEQRMLMADFKLMLWWCGLTRRLYLTAPARHSLSERARILAYFAHTLAARTSPVTRA
jgi:hypothetical protein